MGFLSFALSVGEACDESYGIIKLIQGMSPYIAENSPAFVPVGREHFVGHDLRWFGQAIFRSDR